MKGRKPAGGRLFTRRLEDVPRNDGISTRVFHFRRILKFQGANVDRGSRCAENETEFFLKFKYKIQGLLT